MAISFGQDRSYDNSFTAFQSLIKGRKTAPSLNNLYGIEFSAPPVLTEKYGQRLIPGGFLSEGLSVQLNHYCTEIGTPTRNITTSQVNQIGAAFKYATAQSHSEVTGTFIMSRDTRTYTFFERWMMSITSDADQYVDFMSNYSCTMKIFKFERGQGKKVEYKESDLIKEQQGGSGKKQGFYYQNEITGCWVLTDVFPTNLSQIQLTSGKADFTTFTVGFQYRNFRYYPNNKNIDLRSYTELGTNPQQNYVNSLGDQSLAQDAFNAFTNPILNENYSEFLSNNNFDFSAVAKPEFNVDFQSNLAFDTSTFTQPPGTAGLNFWGNTAPDNNG